MGNLVEIRPKQITTLVADDDHDYLEMMQMVLESTGIHKVYTAENPQKALIFARNMYIHVLLTDLRMPKEGDGMRLVRDFKQFPHLSKAGIVVISGTLDDLTKEDEALINAKVQKPFETERLINITQHLARHCLEAA